MTAEQRLDYLYCELASLQRRFAEADDAEKQELEDPISMVQIEIEDIEDDLALAEEAALRSDYYRSRI